MSVLESREEKRARQGAILSAFSSVALKTDSIRGPVYQERRSRYIGGHHLSDGQGILRKRGQLVISATVVPGSGRAEHVRERVQTQLLRKTRRTLARDECGERDKASARDQVDEKDGVAARV